MRNGIRHILIVVGLLVAGIASAEETSPLPVEEAFDALFEEHDGLPWKEEAGFLQFFKRADLSRLVIAFEKAKSDGFHVVHMGDSHVQGGLQRKSMEPVLKDRLGDGGPGLFFSYGMMKRRGPKHVKWRYVGEWNCEHSAAHKGRLPYGLLGGACRSDHPLATIQAHLPGEAE